MMLPPDRRYRSRRLRWDWRPLEAARNLVGGGGVLQSGHGVTCSGGNDTTSGACSSDRCHRLSRASFMVTAIAIALLDHVRPEGQRPSDA